MLKISNPFLGTVFAVCAACSSAAPQPESVTTQEAAASSSSVDGVFERYLVSPRGEVDGLVLADGTIARFAPHRFVDANESMLNAGDAVRLEGPVRVGATGRVVERATITKGAVVVVASERDPGSAPPPPPSHPAGDPDADLSELTAKGSIARFIAGPRGDLDGFLLSDGTAVRAGRNAHLATLGLKIGDLVGVSGHGGSYPEGKALHLESMVLPNGESRTLERPRAKRSPATRAGTVSRLLINPHGDLDGVVLAPGEVVRFRPTPAGSLSVGSKLQATGAATEHALEADSVRLDSGQALALGPAGVPHSPSPLSPLEDTAVIDQVIPNADGEAEMLVLRDGALVRVPPELQSDAGPWLTTGSTVHAVGEGGMYAGVKAMRATSLSIAGKQFTADTRPVPPPPRQALIP